MRILGLIRRGGRVRTPRLCPIRQKLFNATVKEIQPWRRFGHHGRIWRGSSKPRPVTGDSTSLCPPRRCRALRSANRRSGLTWRRFAPGVFVAAILVYFFGTDFLRVISYTAFG